MQKKEFHLGDILSITTGRLVSQKHIGGVYEILNFMTRDNLFTHQLPRACDECKPYLARQFPQLSSPNIDADVNELTQRMNDTKDSNNDIVDTWLNEMVEKHGEYFEVEEMPLDDHIIKDPLEELSEKIDS